MPRPNRKLSSDSIKRPYIEVATRFREFRLSKGLNQTDLEESGFKVLTIRRAEAGLFLPSPELLIYMRNKHGMDINYVLCGK